jgi:membrane-associated phospholipid phosphatase
MFGKPRPVSKPKQRATGPHRSLSESLANVCSQNMLAHCLPDLNRIAEYYVGGYGQPISDRWVLVDYHICTQTDLEFMDDGFRSFPSGHSSWSWAGLLYLTLFLCSKFAIAIPHLPLTLPASSPRPQQPENDHELLPLHANRARGESMDTKREFDDAGPATVTADPLSLRNAAAAPPNYLIIPALTPVAVAVWICSTRYAEFYHFGFDIISGSLIGIVSAWLSFRWYHLPISRGQGWAWGARSRHRAFAIGVGTGGYVGDEGWHNGKAAMKNDLPTRV